MAASKPLLNPFKEAMLCVHRGDLKAYRGVNPAAQDNGALRVAARRGDMLILQFLCQLPLDRAVDPSDGVNDALVWAARLGHQQVVRYLCELPIARGVNSGAQKIMAAFAAAHKKS